MEAIDGSISAGFLQMLSGIVEDVGENVSSVKVGEYVSAETHIVCGECVPCVTGKSHVCTNTAIIGVDTAGCFAEYVKVRLYSFLSIAIT